MPLGRIFFFYLLVLFILLLLAWIRIFKTFLYQGGHAFQLFESIVINRSFWVGLHPRST